MFNIKNVFFVNWKLDMDIKVGHFNVSTYTQLILSSKELIGYHPSGCLLYTSDAADEHRDV